jgi:hypothetical protein
LFDDCRHQWFHWLIRHPHILLLNYILPFNYNTFSSNNHLNFNQT